MLKSSKLVLGLGVLLGLSVAVLPTRSFAAVTVKQSTPSVTATIAGLIGFSAINHTPKTNVTTYNSTTNTYSGTFNIMDHTDEFGITTYEVMCNYRSGTPYDYYDENFPDNPVSMSYYANTDCANGWEVKAISSTKSANNYATMVGATTSAVIESTSPTSNPLTGSTPNWVMKVNGISKTVGSQTFSTSAASTFGSFSAIPAVTATAVAEGNTFRTVNSVANTYIGVETFEVQYGFNAGFSTADTYTGTITYTLHVKAAS